MPGLRFVGALLLSCLLGFLWRLIAIGGSSFCTAGLLGVHVMWCLWAFLLEVGFLGGPIWGMVGVMGCLWWVSPRPLGQACWRCLVVPVLLRLGVPLEISALGGDVLRPSCVFFWWVGCVWVVVAWLLWSASGGVLRMCGQCGAYMVWVGFFSLWM